MWVHVLRTSYIFIWMYFQKYVRVTNTFYLLFKEPLVFSINFTGNFHGLGTSGLSRLEFHLCSGESFCLTYIFITVNIIQILRYIFKQKILYKA